MSNLDNNRVTGLNIIFFPLVTHNSIMWSTMCSETEALRPPHNRIMCHRLEKRDHKLSPYSWSRMPINERELLACVTKSGQSLCVYDFNRRPPVIRMTGAPTQ
jgi:hypothetical protein